MEYVTLGRTGLNVSVLSLGGGGHSKLGMDTGKAEEESINIVRKAVELGVNLFDSAEVYGTEKRFGDALQNMGRDKLYVSTKYTLHQDKRLKRPEEIEKSIDQSLLRWGTDYIDIYHLHGVNFSDYLYSVNYLFPELIKMQEKGKIRFMGITEAFGGDPSHKMLEIALQDDCWDVMMVGYNFLNQSARDKILIQTKTKNIGVMAMFAVRRALSQKEALKDVIDHLLEQGNLNLSQVDREDPLGFLIHENGAESLTDAAYRFCRHEDGIHTVLSGTGNVDHLFENVKSANRGPLSELDLHRVKQMFLGVDSISGN